MAQPRILRFLTQALLGLLLVAWLPAVVGEAADGPFLPQIEDAFFPSVLSDDGEPDRDGWSDGKGPLLSNAACELAGMQGREIRQGTSETNPFLNLLDAWRATGPPGLDL